MDMVIQGLPVTAADPYQCQALHATASTTHIAEQTATL
jgi:hypothetical protein